ncbi:MAG: PKD domain-containing protein [Chloroflexi bacterium]|nr:PKD domain-containing protein [Chloroflexota bacterium]
MYKYILNLLLIFLGTACAGTSVPVQKQNNIPVIEQVIYSQDSMAAADNTIICQASDPDGDNLQYRWSADNGRITGDGTNITWVSPDTMGNYKVTVLVTDGKGGEVVQTVNIRVLNNADGTTMPPITLKMTLPVSGTVSEKMTVKVGTVTKVICATEGSVNSKLTYAWTSEGGKLKAKGLDEKTSAAVYWTAPTDTKVYLVTVIVSDEQGNKAQGQVIFDVFCCPRN